MRMIRKSLIIYFTLVVFLILVFTMQSFAQPEYKWRFTMPWERELSSESFELFCHLVGVYSDGRIEIEYFPHGLLGTLDENFHAIQAGEIELGLSYTFANLVPGGVVALMPFSVSSWDEMAFACRRPDGFLYKVTNVAWEEVGVHLLFMAPQGFLGFANNVRPLKTPDDLKNLRLRVSGSLQLVEMLENMGKGTGMTMNTLPWADAYGAFERGVLDGGWTGIAQMVEERHFEVQKYFTDLRFSHDLSCIIINKDIWDELPDDLKEAIEKAIKITTERDFEAHRRGEIEFRNILKDMGAEVYYPTDEERSLWIEKARVPEIWENLAKPWLDKAFPGQNMVETLLEEVENMKKYVAE